MSQIKAGDIIKVSYTGTFDNGEVFDATSHHDDELLEFTVGEQQVIPGFDTAVLGKELHEEFEIRIEPKDGYGEYNEKAVQQIKRSDLPDDVEPKKGMMLQLQHQHEDHVHHILATITDFDEEKVVLDLNHPLAGKVLNFKIKIEDIQ